MDQECTAREQEEKAVSSVSFRMYSTHSTQYVHMHCSNVHTGLQFICTYKPTIHMYIQANSSYVHTHRLTIHMYIQAYNSYVHTG
jgi:hypothetical protein